ncbi:prolipoprotein diacylglyceryl transferase [Hymenobacter sp. BT186]|uniref:Prolipoprotein diacylglyceryl transferase n=1 Tax=Hymenobacter telluris TaxID=2816474 RepID=A0A939EVP0_9BACT|nr:prolipoprotein diacylglyceryl transferase family protein [Hymenobacter telluris]MBO0358066.1 prolipoprotein diacylglyceryl transferase [Hymenobacter telluris]MBW3374093.1 prolipoprotein diacylglyceryl transferase [Hymenobacter norwichensis]
MTYPVHLTLGPLFLPVHLLCEVLAYTLGYRFYQRLRTRTPDPISDEHRLWIFVGAAAGALLGSRLLGLLEHPDLLMNPPGGWPYYFTNKTIVGGFLGGLVGVELTKKRLGVTASSGDLMVFPLLLGLGIGRLGCHLSGLEDGTFGTATALPWGINFGDGIQRHPTNLYEILFLAALALLLWLLERRQPLPDGRRFQLFLAAYLLFRLLVEFIKPTPPLPGLGLTAIQWACVAGLGYYVWVWTRQKLYHTSIPSHK